MSFGIPSYSSQRNKSTILVIEDEEALSALLRDELTSCGYRVVLARDGVDGLGQIQNVEPDLIICDRAMPQMTGTQLLERLRGAYPQYSAIPFIFMTAMTSSHDKESVRGLGPFAYLEKPLDFGLLRQTVKKALGEP